MPNFWIRSHPRLQEKFCHQNTGQTYRRENFTECVGPRVISLIRFREQSDKTGRTIRNTYLKKKKPVLLENFFIYYSIRFKIRFTDVEEQYTKSYTNSQPNRRGWAPEHLYVKIPILIRKMVWLIIQFYLNFFTNFEAILKNRAPNFQVNRTLQFPINSLLKCAENVKNNYIGMQIGKINKLGIGI